MKKIIQVILVLSLCLSLISCQSEAKYPAKEIRLIVPYGIGGTTDLSARALAQSLEKELGSKIVVVNKAGASGSVATKYVMGQKADGYTLFLTADSLASQRVMGLSNYSFADFDLVSSLVNDPKLIVVGKDSPYLKAEDLFAAMKSKDKLKMAHTGPGGSGHVQGLIYERAGFKPAMTSYAGGAKGLLAVISGEVDFTNANYSSVKSYLEAGEIKALAVFAKEGLKSRPEIPAISKVVPELEKYAGLPLTPLNLIVKKGLEPERLELLRTAFKQAVLSPEWQNFVLENELLELYQEYPSQEEMAAFCQSLESSISYLLYDYQATERDPAEFGIKRVD